MAEQSTGQGIFEDPEDEKAAAALLRRQLAEMGGTSPPPPGAAATAPGVPAGAPPSGGDPFTAMGGGVQLPNGDWVPQNHPLATQAGGGASAPSVLPGGPTGAPVPGAPPSQTTLAGQAGASASYTPRPTGAPTAPTTNAGTQDVVRNSYLAQATQSTQPTRTDPSIRVPADAFRANVDRAARNTVADVAEAAGPYATGAVRGETRMANERAGIAAGTFEAELLTRELQTRRDEVQQALTSLSGQLTEDQRQALQREMTQINLQMEQARLGQDQMQFADTLGLNVADREAYWSDQALRRALGQ